MARLNWLVLTNIIGWALALLLLSASLSSWRSDPFLHSSSLPSPASLSSLSQHQASTDDGSRRPQLSSVEGRKRRIALDTDTAHRQETTSTATGDDAPNAPPPPADCHGAESTTTYGATTAEEGGETDPMAEDTRVFEQLAHRCTDKTRAHKYQYLYAHVLHRFRHQQQGRRGSSRGGGGSDPEGTGNNRTKPFRMLEIGLGCNMIKCVGGSFRLMQKYLPNVEYFVFEYNMKGCRQRYKRSGVTAQESEYLDRHLCEGSSGDPAALEACGKKFGPFDIIIDDASHMVEHVMTAYRFFFPSAFLKYGGVYIAEDLQTHYMAEYVANQKEVHMGTHVGNLIQYKLAVNPNTGHVSGPVGFKPVLPETPYLAWLTQLVHCSQEICAFEKVPQRPKLFPQGFPETWKSV